MAKLIKNSLGNFLVIFVIFSLIFSWFFSGWPRIWQKPSIPPEVKEALAAADKVEFIVYTVTATTTWTVPSDWTASNTIEVIGGGGGGSSANSIGAGGGGGGAYAKISNLTTLTVGSSITVRVGATGTAETAGGDTYFNGSGTTCSGQSVCAKGGAGSSGVTGGAGGASSTDSIGEVKYKGGNGGTGDAGKGDQSGGGGGAAGPHTTNGNGWNGGSITTAGEVNGGGGGGGGGGGSGSVGAGGALAGGNGGNGYLGTGAGAGGSGTNVVGGNATATAGGGGGGDDGGNGGNGTTSIYWTESGTGRTAGPGGAGGGGGDNCTGTGGLGAHYGAGGGGCEGIGGAGAQGIIVITYTPNNAPSFAKNTEDTPDSVTQGQIVTFTATSTDSDGDSWYLAVCKTNAVTPGSGGGAPTCASEANTYCTSTSAVASGSQNTCTWTSTASGDWWSFACDNNSTQSKCSLYNNDNSPITVNVATVSCSTDISTTDFGPLTSDSIFTSVPDATTTMTCANSVSGCTMGIQDTGTSTGAISGLSAGSVNAIIESPNAAFSASTTLVAGIEGFGLLATTTSAGSGATLIIGTRYNSTGNWDNNIVGGASTTAQTLATANSSTSARVVSVRHKAAISDNTLSGNYKDTIYYQCAGN